MTCVLRWHGMLLTQLFGDGYSPCLLYSAAMLGLPGMVKLLLSQGEDKYQVDDLTPALGGACLSGNEQVRGNRLHT